jgi:hypothetical protein
MRSLRSCPVLFLSLMLLTGLAGCGQTSSDGSRASIGGQPLSQQGPSPGNNPLAPVTSAASPVPLALGEKPGISSEKETGGSRSLAVPVPSSQAKDSADALVVPAWMAKELDSPDAGVRIRALETWVQSAPPGSIDPLILAYEDKDERVRARAMELIEQDWARTADTDQSGGEGEVTNEIAEPEESETPSERSASDPVNK